MGANPGECFGGGGTEASWLVGVTNSQESFGGALVGGPVGGVGEGVVGGVVGGAGGGVVIGS